MNLLDEPSIARVIRPLSLRWQLPLLLMLLAAPLLAWLAASAARQATYEREAAARRLDGLAHIAATTLDARLSDLAQTLALASTQVGTAPEDAGHNHLLLLEWASHLPAGVVDLAVWSAAGEYAGSLDVRSHRAGASAAYRPFFIEALSSPRAAAEIPATARAPSTAVVARRIERDGRVVGVVSATLRLAELHLLLAAQAEGSGAALSITDARGQVLARSVEADQGSVGELRVPGGDTLVDGATGAVRRSSRLSWFVHADWSDDTARAQARARIDWPTAAAWLVPALLLAVFLGSRWSAALARLTQAVNRLADGEKTVPTRPGGAAEFDVLAAALARASAAIAQREKLHELSEEALADLYDNAPFGYYSLDTRGCFVRINQTALGWFGCSREEAIGRLGIVDFMRAEGVAAFKANFPRLLREDRVDNIEFDLVGKAGQVRRVVVSATAVRDAKGEFCLTRTAMHDLSAVRAAATVEPESVEAL